MAINTLNGRSFEVDDEGYLVNRDEWDEDLAAELAAVIGVELHAEHIKVLQFMREDAARTGKTPTLRRIQTEGGFDVAELFTLFPDKPAKKMAWLAGLPKPVGCV